MHFTTSAIVSLLATANAAILNYDNMYQARGLNVGAKTKLYPVSKRASSDTSLKDRVNWFWGEGSNPNAELTCWAKSDNEKFLSMEEFGDVLQSTSCSDGSIQFTFSDSGSFRAAQQSWQWVNQQSANYINLVTEEQSCSTGGDKPDNAIPGMGAAGPRQPYKVTSANFNAGDMTATFTGQATTWEDALGHAWNLRASTSGLSGVNNQLAGSNLTRRDDPKFISLEADFSRPIVESKEIAGVTASLNCDPCGTSGGVNIDTELSGKFTPPFVEGTFTITPQDLAASVSLKLAVGGALTEELSAELQLLDLPLPGGFSIPGILELGPQLVVDASAGITEVSAEASISFGVDITIPNESSATVDFDDSSKNSASGWNPSFNAVGPSVDASVSVSGSAGPRIALQLALTVVGKGAAAGIQLAAPTFDMNFAAQASSEGVCDSPDQKVGIQFDAGVSAVISGFGGFGDVSDPDIQFDIFSTGVPIFSTCIGLGGGDAAPTSSAAPVTSSAPGQVAPPASIPAQSGVSTVPCPSGSSGGVCGVIPAGSAAVPASSAAPAASSAAPAASAAPSVAASQAIPSSVGAPSSAAPQFSLAASSSAAGSAAASAPAVSSAPAASAVYRK